MEKYLIKVIIENVSGTVLGETTIDTISLSKDTNLVDDFINTTLHNIADERRGNPHHHQNRLD